MNSRREFLGTSCIALAALAANSRGAGNQGENTPAGTGTRQRDYWNDLPRRLTAQVNAARAKRKSELVRLKSRGAADERIALVRTRVWELIGGKLDETSLNARTTGTIDRDAYRI